MYIVKIKPMISKDDKELEKVVVDEVAKFLINVLPETMIKEIQNMIED